jgi:uncharacterized membrane protein HdeD (DUF308 family)
MLQEEVFPLPDYHSFAETPEMFAGRRLAIVLRGIVAILFAVLAFALPGETVRILMRLFGCYALLEGLCILIAALGRHRWRYNRWLLALEGIVGMTLGIVVLIVPAGSPVVLFYFISIWAVALGFLRVSEAILLRKEISGEMWFPLSGVVAILFAVSLMLRPHRLGPIAMIWLVAGYALVTGLFEVLLGIELRRSHDIASRPNDRQKRA